MWLTGAAWLVLHHFYQVQGDFGREPSPAEPWLLRIHGAAMLAAMVGVGSLFVVHFWRGWNYPSQRLLGVSLLGVVVTLTVTGYLLYYVADDRWREWLSAAHWLVGLAAVFVFGLHYRSGRRLRRP